MAQSLSILTNLGVSVPVGDRGRVAVVQYAVGRLGEVEGRRAVRGVPILEVNSDVVSGKSE